MSDALAPATELRFVPRITVEGFRISSAVDLLGLHYVISHHVSGFNSVAQVLHAERGTLYRRSWVGYRVHIDEIRRHLQRVADDPETLRAALA